MRSVLVATLDQGVVKSIESCLGEEYRLTQVRDMDSCLESFRARRPDYTFLDLDMPGVVDGEGGAGSAAGLLAPFRVIFPTAHLIVLASEQHIRLAVAAVKAGADDYLTRPLDSAEISLVMEDLRQRRQMESELDYLRDSFSPGEMEQLTQSRSPRMMEALDKIRRVAPTLTTVLFGGETGTGKSLMARLIHLLSNRSRGPFIAVHCGTIPDNLVESELFGHEKGSFTGATRRKLGKFQIADGGTIFLDEIGTITPMVQVKLLQVLQERRFTRVGGESEIKVDVRVVAAANADLEELCRQGLFRRDLYYRLQVFPIDLPPLRERKEDLPLLVRHLLDRLNRTQGKNLPGLEPGLLESLSSYSWPGNIRELENLVERAYILERGPLLTASGFPREILGGGICVPGGASDDLPSLAQLRRTVLDGVEKDYLQKLLALHQGRIDKSAAHAGITTRQLNNLMTRYSLRKEEFK